MTDTLAADELDISGWEPMQPPTVELPGRHARPGGGRWETRFDDRIIEVAGYRIGGVYYGYATRRWVSYGPAGFVSGHRHRRDAVAVQVAAFMRHGNRWHGTVSMEPDRAQRHAARP